MTIPGLLRTAPESRRFESCRSWLDAREFCELSALTVMDSYPEHTLSALAYMADTERCSMVFRA